MKKLVYEFENGEIRFDNEKPLEEKLIRWGLKDIPYVIREATEEEIKTEKVRVGKIEDEAFDVDIDNYYIDEENKQAMKPKL
jgi:hypothetical protein